MPIMKAVVQLAANSALPRDASELTLFYSFTSTPGTGALDSIASLVAAFFNNTSVSGVSASVGSRLAKDRDYSTNACKVVWYTMPSTAGPTGPPFHVSSWTLTAPGTVINLPDQVAVVCSYHSDLTGVSTHIGRHRGRFYIGPLNELAMNSGTGSVAPQTVSASFMTDIGLEAKTQLRDNTATYATWVQFSRTDWTGRAVTAGFVDDRFDTQRRRLQRADSRILWS